MALSSCEAEYIGAASAAQQGVWLSRLLAEMPGVDPRQFKLRVDNKSVISLCRNPVLHDRSKHIDTRFHFIRECIEEAKIDIKHVSTNGQRADILTKSLGHVKFIETWQMLGTKEVSPVQQR